MAGIEKPVFIRIGEGVKIVLEGGPTIDIKNTPEIKHGSPISSQAQKEQLRARFPNLLEAFVRASADQHGYRLLGGNEIGGEMEVDDARNKLEECLKLAQEAGISDREIISVTKGLLRQVAIASSKMDKPGFLVQEVTTEINALVSSVWKKD